MMTSTAASPADALASPQRALPPLTRLDDYEIEAVLAQSALTVVYRAYDRALQRPVAIKEYLPDTLAQRGAAGRVVPRSRAGGEGFEIGRAAFVVEAQTLAGCDHPALLRVLRLLRANGTVYRVMPLVSGVSLLEHCRAPRAAPGPAQLRRWLDLLLGALAVLHDAGFVHGAVAPGNIVLQPDGQPLLLDFDAVRLALRSDGTRNLLSQREPAQYLSGPCTDLHDLAASLLACANAARDGNTAGSFAAHWRRRHGDLPMPGEVARCFGALDICLAEEPAQRPQSVAALRLLIEAGEHSQPEAQARAAPIPAAARPDAAPLSAEEAAADGARVIADLDQTFAFIAAQAAAPHAAASGPLFCVAHEAGLPPLSMSEARPVPASAKRPAVVGRFAAAATLLILAAAAWWWADAPQQRGEAVVARSAAPGPVAAETALPTPTPTPASRAESPAPPSTPAPAPTPQAAPAADASAVAQTPDLLDSAQPPGASSASPPVAAPPAATAPAAKAAAVPPRSHVAAKPPSASHKAAPTKLAAASPREVCGPRTQFSLYRCMHTQCAKAQWHDHAQCRRLRRADAVN